MKAKRLTLTLALSLTLVGGATLAHGNKVHIKGKVEKIGADSLQIKTADGKAVELKLIASTVYVLHLPAKPGDPPDTNQDKLAKLADLASGDSVVIHATPKGGVLEANEIKFSAAGSSKVASAAKPKS